MDIRQQYDNITHAVGSLAATGTAFYWFSVDFRNWIGDLLIAYKAHMPHLLQPLPLVFVAWLAYRNAKSGTGDQQKGHHA